MISKSPLEIRIALVASALLLLPSCSNQDNASNGPCEQLLSCCDSLSSVFRAQCQQSYDQWHQSSRA